MFTVNPNEFIEKDYLYTYLKQDKIYQKLNNSNGSSAMPALNFGSVGTLNIEYPKSVEQLEISKLFNNIDNLITLHQRKCNYILSHKLNIKLFFFKITKNVWEQRKLGEIYRFQYGMFNNNPSNGGKYPVYGANGIIGGFTNYNAENSVIIGHMGEYAGSVLWGEGKHFVTYNGTISSPRQDFIAPKFGYYMLFNKDINKICGGSGLPFLSYEQLNKIDINFPRELKEQIKISTMMSNLDNLITLHQRKCTYIFYSWEQRKLNNMCSIITKQTGFDYSATIKPSLIEEKNNECYSFIQNKDFDGLKINLNTDFYIPKKVADKFPKITLDTPSLLISISGKIGNVGFYSMENNAFIGGAVGICKLIKPEDGVLFTYELESDYGQRYFQSLIKASSHANITVEDIRKIELIVPKNDSEKNKISNFLLNLDNLITLHQHKELKRRNDNNDNLRW